MTLYEKVQTLCRNEGFEISNLGEKVPGLSITRGSISGWKRGATPRAPVVKAIADYFGVTTEYLMNDDVDEDSISEISIRLERAIKESKLSPRDLESMTGIPHSAIRRYASGSTDRIPIGKIEKLAQVLNVPVEYLLGWTDKESTYEFMSGVKEVETLPEVDKLQLNSEKNTKFKERLLAGMSEKNLKAVDLVRLTGLSKSQISHYMTGRYEAKQSALHKLAVALGVSDAWLMGYDTPMQENTYDVYKPSKPDDRNAENISTRLKWLMNHNNWRQIDIVNMCKPIATQYHTRIGRNDISQYISGKFEPGHTKLYIISKALGVNEAWLLGYDAPIERSEIDKKLSADDLSKTLFPVNADDVKTSENDDDELYEYLEMLRNRPEMRMFFSFAKGATRKEIEQAVAIIEVLRKSENR